MKNIRLIITLLTCASLAGLGIAKYADGQSSPVAKSWPEDRAKKIFSPQENIRRAATYDLMQSPGKIENFLVSQSDQPNFWENRDSEGATVLAIQTLGFYGSEHTAYTIPDHIGFQVDAKTWKVGESRSAIADYPVAATLAQIGGLAVRRNVLQRLYRTQSERELRLCLWVLNETETAEITRYLLDTTRQSATQRVATEEIERATANLERAQKLMETPDDLLRFDPATP